MSTVQTNPLYFQATPSTYCNSIRLINYLFQHLLSWKLLLMTHECRVLTLARANIQPWSLQTGRSHLTFVLLLVQGKPGKDGDPGNPGFPVSCSVHWSFTGMCFSRLRKCCCNKHFDILCPHRVPKESRASQELQAEMERECVF